MNRHQEPAAVVETLINQRRSIRKYTADPVPEDWIDAILRCGAQAPSPTNSQPVRYIRIASPGLRAGLHKALLDGHRHLLARHKAVGADPHVRNWINAYRRYAEFMVLAPVLICVGVARQVPSFGGRMASAGLIPRDPRQGTDADICVGLALKGILLKAQSLGLGSCILTAPLVFIEDVEGILDLADFQAKCFLTLGFAAEAPAANGRLPLESVYKVL